MKRLRWRIEELKRYFENQPEVLFAFLFGSSAKGSKTQDSDIDIAVYLKPKKKVEIEEKREYPERERIWSDLVDILERDDIDVVVLNMANPVLAYNILKTGIPLVIKDNRLYLDFYLIVSNEAEDFFSFMEDYLKFKISSMSLTEEARQRLILRFDYLLTYWPEKEKFSKLDFDTYKDNPDQRRNMERWVENIANATIDIAKIILASEKKQMPKSYTEALLDFGLFFGLKGQDARRFSDIADLRNLLAHEYLEVLYGKIKDFLINISPFYKRLISFLNDYVIKEAEK